MAVNTYQPVNKTDKPPTKADAKMRKKHTTDSVSYNLNNMRDHGEALNQSLSKLKTVAPQDSKNLAQDASKIMGAMHQQINQAAGMSGNMNMKGSMMVKKPTKDVENAADTKKPGDAKEDTTKKTGSFQGKSNALGGGGRAAQLKAKGLSGALIGYIGRKKYGAKAMGKMSAKGRARPSK